MSWTCVNCETSNPDDVLACEVCGFDRPVENVWNCPACETVNPEFADECEVCGTARAAAEIRPLKPEPDQEQALTLQDFRQIMAQWKVPGEVTFTSKKVIPIFDPPRVPKGDFIHDRVLVPVKRLTARFLNLPRKKRRTIASRFLVALGISTFWFGFPFWIMFGVGVGIWSIAAAGARSGVRKALHRWSRSGDVDEYIAISSRDTYFEGHSTRVESMTFSKSGDELVSLDRSGNMIRWKSSTGEVLKSRKVIRESFMKSAIGRNYAFGLSYFSLNVFEASGKEKHQLRIQYPLAQENPLLVSRDQHWVAVGSETGQILIWGTRHFTKTTLSGIFSNSIRAMDFGPAKNLLIAGSESGAVGIYSVTGSTQKFFYSRTGVPVTAVVAGPNLTFAAAFGDGEVIRWSYRNGQLLDRWKLNDHPVDSRKKRFAKYIFLGVDSLFSIDDYGKLNEWFYGEEAPGERLFEAKSDMVTAAQFHYKQKMLMVGGVNGELEMVDLS